MIILILILFAIFLFVFNVLPVVKNNHFWAVLCLIGFIASGFFIVLNDVNHFGMSIEKKTKTYTLTSSSKKMNVLLYQGLGNGSEKIYIYKTNASQKKPLTTKTTKYSTKLTKTNKNSTLKVTTERYIYKNSLSKLLFGIFGNNNDLKHRYYHFRINKNWYILSTSQAKQLAKLISANKTTMQQEISTSVKSYLAKELAKNPTLSQSQQKLLMQQAEIKATKNILDRYVAEIKE